MFLYLIIYQLGKQKNKVFCLNKLLKMSNSTAVKNLKTNND